MTCTWKVPCDHHLPVTNVGIKRKTFVNFLSTSQKSRDAEWTEKHANTLVFMYFTSKSINVLYIFTNVCYLRNKFILAGVVLVGLWVSENMITVMCSRRGAGYRDVQQVSLVLNDFSWICWLMLITFIGLYREHMKSESLCPQLLSVVASWVQLWLSWFASSATATCSYVSV